MSSGKRNEAELEMHRSLAEVRVTTFEEKNVTVCVWIFLGGAVVQ